MKNGCFAAIVAVAVVVATIAICLFGSGIKVRVKTWHWLRSKVNRQIVRPVETDEPDTPPERRRRRRIFGEADV